MKTLLSGSHILSRNQAPLVEPTQNSKQKAVQLPNLLNVSEAKCTSAAPQRWCIGNKKPAHLPTSFPKPLGHRQSSRLTETMRVETIGPFLTKNTIWTNSNAVNTCDDIDWRHRHWTQVLDKNETGMFFLIREVDSYYIINMMAQCVTLQFFSLPPPIVKKKCTLTASSWWALSSPLSLLGSSLSSSVRVLHQVDNPTTHITAEQSPHPTVPLIYLFIYIFLWCHKGTQEKYRGLVLWAGGWVGGSSI